MPAATFNSRYIHCIGHYTGPVNRNRIIVNALPSRRYFGNLSECRTPSLWNSIVHKAAEGFPATEMGEDRQLQDCVNARDWLGASKIVLNLLSQDSQMDPTIIERVLIGLCLQNKWRQAIQLYNKVDPQKLNLSYHTFHCLFQAALKEGAFNIVRKLYKDAKQTGITLNVVTCSMVISGLLKDKRKGSSSWSLAYQMWCDAKKTNIKYDAAFFRAGCSACVSARKLKEAEELIPIMRQKGFHPDERFYNILIKGYCRIPNMKSAARCFQEMKAQDIQVSKVTYNTLIHGFVLCNEVEKGEKMLRFAQSDECTLDVWSYTTLIDGYLQVQNFPKAQELLKEFRALGGKPNEVTYSAFINSYVDQNKLFMAHSCLDMMRKEGLKPNLIIYNTLLKGYSSQGLNSSYEKVIALLKEMKSHGIQPKIDTFNTLLSGLMESQDMNAVQGLVYEMMKLGIEPDGVSYTYLMRQPGKDFEEVFKELEESENDCVDLVCCNLLVALFSEAKNFEKAEKALQRAVVYAQEHNFATPVAAYGAIIKGYIQNNDLSKAISKFRQFCTIGGQPDIHLIESLLKACIKEGDTHHALKLLRASKFLDKELNLDKYRKLVLRAERRSKDIKKAETPSEGGFETLKFWLGIPNTHYSSDWP